MKKPLFACCLCLAAASGLLAQSYHFSQFFSTPLLTNPAHTGLMDGPFRVASNFRSQGQTGGSPYFTGYLSADVGLFRNTLADGHTAGVGLYVMNDQSLNGGLQTNTVGLSAAYNVGLDADGQYSLGVGLQGTYNQRRFDYSKLSFGEQFGPNGYDPSLPVSEPLGNTGRNYFDANAGILYNAVLEDRSFFGGVAVYNILRHNENVLAEEFKVPTRYALQAGAQFYSGRYGKVYASLTHMNQASATETTAGLAYGHQLTDDEEKNEINFGLWYRWKDAVVPYVGYQRGGFQLGLTYDYTVSGLKAGAQVRNGYELTLLYKAIDKRRLKMLIPWY